MRNIKGGRIPVILVDRSIGHGPLDHVFDEYNRHDTIIGNWYLKARDSWDDLERMRRLKTEELCIIHVMQAV